MGGVTSPRGPGPSGNGDEGAKAAKAPFILCMGDDRSDEAMFTVLQSIEHHCSHPSSGADASVLQGSLPGATLGFSPVNTRNSVSHASSCVFSCCVGIQPSKAHYFLHDSEEVVGYLRSLLALG